MTEELKRLLQNASSNISTSLQSLAEVCSCTKGLFWRKCNLNNCVILYFSDIKLFQEHLRASKYNQHDRQCTYNVTMWRVRVAVIAVEANCLLHCWATLLSITKQYRVFFMFLRRIYLTCSSKTYSGFHVKCPHFCTVITKFEISQQTFSKAPTIKFHENPCTNSRANTSR